MKITFKIGEENKPKKEIIDSMALSNSLFCEQYKYALQTIDSYLQKCDEDKKSHKNQTDTLFSVDDRNNIFAFLGDRGSGKTSCMTSVAEFLCHKDKSVLDEYQLKYLDKHEFYPLDLVDPLFFDSQHNILSMIIAELYKRYQIEKKRRKDNNTLSVDKCRNLLELFNRTQKYLTYMLGKHEYEDDNLRELNNLSTASDLKKTIHELIQSFFDCFDLKGRYLLMLIDDVDLNTKEADKMTEQIRKYFIQEDIIILMALKLDQLEQIKKLSYTNEYSKLLEKQRMDYSDIDEMVDRYVVKFIPYDQRFYMPDYEYYINSQLIVENNGISEEFPSIKHAVPELIFRKTRYLFYNSDIKISPIVPTNLRELRQLIASLYVMDDYWEGDSHKVSNQYNKTLFKKYLFEDWATYKLRYKDKMQIQNILEIRDALLFNSTISSILIKKYFSSLYNIGAKSDRSLEENEIAYISSHKNLGYNISIGDVISLIDIIESRSTSIEDSNFLFLLKSICSMRLYESYDTVTEGNHDGHLLSVNNSEQDKSILREVLREDQLKDLTLYDEFVGGRYVNTQLDDPLPKISQSGDSRSFKCINCFQLNKLISFCLNHWDTEHADYIRLSEFFMLCISRDFSTQNQGNAKVFYDGLYRVRKDISYAKSLDSGTKNVSFDINSFMFNVTRIELCYKRFQNGDEFFNRADKDEDGLSLWSLFKKSSIRQRHPEYTSEDDIYQYFDYNEWLSVCSLRNVEIIQNLYKHIGIRKNRTGADMNVLASYFTDLGSYSIQSYDRTRDGKDFYSISFSFANKVSELLNRVAKGKDALLKSFFEKIYSGLIQPIEIDKIVKGTLKNGNNKKSTILSNIKKLFPEQMSDSDFAARVNSEFDKLSERVSRDEIIVALTNVNKDL